MKKILVSVNGNITKKEDAKISIFDRSFLFGDSIYEVTKSSNFRLEFLDKHLDRLENSASLLDIPFNGMRDYIKMQLIHLNERMNVPSSYFRVIVTRGLSYECNLSEISSRPNVVIIAKEFHSYPNEWYEQGVRLMVSKYRRNHPKCLDPNAKSGNYLNNVLANQEALRAGYYDSIMLNLDNKVAECTTSNIWMVKDGKIISPHHQYGLLKGITRHAIMQICQEKKIPLEMKAVTTRDLEGADECFISSSTKEIIPVTEIYTTQKNTYKIGMLTKDIMKFYKEYTKNESKS